MPAKLISVLLLLIGVIHLLPLSGLLGPEKLENLYGITVIGNDLDILLRHRAVLFGMLGAFICLAAFRPRLQPLAFTTAAISVVSFLALAFGISDFNEAVRRVVVADIVALALLVVAVFVYLRYGASQSSTH